MGIFSTLEHTFYYQIGPVDPVIFEKIVYNEDISVGDAAKGPLPLN